MTWTERKKIFLVIMWALNRTSIFSTIISKVFVKKNLPYPGLNIDKISSKCIFTNRSVGQTLSNH